MKTFSRWNNLPSDTVESPLLDFFQMQLPRVIDNLIWAPFPMGGCTWWSFEVPSDLGCSLILYHASRCQSKSGRSVFWDVLNTDIAQIETCIYVLICLFTAGIVLLLAKIFYSDNFSKDLCLEIVAQISLGTFLLK